jgi:hypothetical protein
MHRLATKRIDVLHTVMSNCCSLNDNFIENHNGLTQQCLPVNMIQTAASVAGAALKSQLKRDLLDGLSDSMRRPPTAAAQPGQGTNQDSASTPACFSGVGLTSFPGKTRDLSGGGGEVYLEETRHERGRGAKQAGHVGAFLQQLMTQMNNACNDTPAPTQGITTVAQMLQHGAMRLQSYADRYNDYLQREATAYQRKQNRATAPGPAQWLADTVAYMYKQTVVILQSFLVAKGECPKAVGRITSKPDLVSRILTNYGHRAFVEHMLATKIDCSIDAQSHIDATAPAAAAAAAVIASVAAAAATAPSLPQYEGGAAPLPTGAA